MKRFKLFTLALALMALFIAAPAHAVLQDMWANVYTWDGKMNTDGKPVLTRLTTGVTFKVLAIGTATAETLYYPNVKAMTSLTNPVTTTNFAAATVCNDRVAFKVDPTDATNDRYVDLIVVNTDGGYTAFVKNFDKYQHTIIIDQRPNVVHQGSIWFGASSTSEINTGIAFHYPVAIHDVAVEVVTAASAISLDVGILSSGTGGDADGFRANVLLTATGFVYDTAFITDGTNIDFVPASTYGVLLMKAVTGSDVTASAGGVTPRKYFINGTSTSTLTYTMDSTSGAGYLHYWFNRIR